MQEVDYKYRNTFHAVSEVLKKEGIRGMYKGLVPNYLKVAPAIGVSFYTYELIKGVLNC
jgi:solute carrier family 25 phosphate transporter 23/24/25/41